MTGERLSQADNIVRFEARLASGVEKALAVRTALIAGGVWIDGRLRRMSHQRM